MRTGKETGREMTKQMPKLGALDNEAGQIRFFSEAGQILKQGMPGCKHMHNETMEAGLTRSRKKGGGKVKMVFASEGHQSRVSRVSHNWGVNIAARPHQVDLGFPGSTPTPRLAQAHMTSQGSK